MSSKKENKKSSKVKKTIKDSSILTDSIGSQVSIEKSLEQEQSLEQIQNQVQNQNSESPKIEYPISDEAIDDIEARVEKFNDTNDLGERMRLHDELKRTILNLEEQIDNMVEIIDKIDVDAINSAMIRNSDTTDNTDITDDIINIEKMVHEMKDEEIMQIKLNRLLAITAMVNKCKSKCDRSNMKVSSVN